MTQQMLAIWSLVPLPFPNPSCTSTAKESACLAGDAHKMQIWSLGWEDPLEKEMATHSSILSWEISWTEELGGLQSMSSQRVKLQLSMHAYTQKRQRCLLDWVLSATNFRQVSGWKTTQIYSYNFGGQKFQNQGVGRTVFIMEALENSLFPCFSRFNRLPQFLCVFFLYLQRQ